MNLDPIRTAPKTKLRDARWLERTIERMGSSQAQNESEYQHNGCGVWQYPSELAPYLVALSKLEIRSYAEIGLWYGGGFALTVEYLKRFGLQVALGIDARLRPSVIEYATQTPGVLLVQAYSADDPARYAVETLAPDLVFIDGDHSYRVVSHDWELASSVARYVGFHDIRFLGVKDLWAEISHRKREFCDVQRDGSGTGLVTV